MKVCRSDIQPGHFLIGDFDSFCVRVDIETGLYGQALAGLCVGNQIDDDLVSFQGATPSIRRDVAKQAMLDPIPCARPRREVTDLDAQSAFIRELLQFVLPQPRPIVVATSSIGRDQ